MRILILGGDGYLGWPTAMYLAEHGHDVHVVDNLAKRQWEQEVGVEPLFPILPFQERIKLWSESRTGISGVVCNIAANRHLLYRIFDEFKPDTVVHYAEQPSAPYSMMDAASCLYTQQNNVSGTLNVILAILHHDPSCHIIKLGTMGEYGTPNIDIEEGWLDVEHNGRTDRCLYPKKPGSWYHLSKVHDSHNLEFACRTWGLRVTDLNQGIVYGTDTDESWLDPGLNTSFHYDEFFGTVINRFLVQAACGVSLTVYGAGGQTRGYLDIRDTLQCVRLACETPASEGEFRVMNQFTEQLTIDDIALRVQDVTDCEIQHIKNPRVEAEEHYYNAKHTALTELGLEPSLLTPKKLETMYKRVKSKAGRINKDVIMPTVRWRQ
jgi:UDP-sulfoquinovose synthase